MIITISDVTLGYGSPQIISFTKEFAECNQDDFTILQPAVPYRQIVTDHKFAEKIRTLPTREHPHSCLGRWQFFQQCKQFVQKYKPDTLIVSNYNLLPILELLEFTPPKIINLVLEDCEHLKKSFHSKVLFSRLQKLSKQIDYWIFPEQNRAINDAELFSIPYEKIFVLPNVYEAKSTFHPKPKIPKILYAGTLDLDSSVACHFTDPSVWKLPLDIYGDSQGTPKNQDKLTSALNQARCANMGLYWYGQVDAQTLDSLLSQYAFSLVFWLPKRFALLNAAPNKFFQALAYGVPVITAPHPQCKMYVERYNCGLVMKDWSKGELIRTVQLGIKLFGTSQYQDMVGGTKQAINQELNWKTQMKLLANKFRLKAHG
ncbi:glycosyltransferase family protein [Gimesia aquarii]|uniref:Glycosyl transferases group 1 n=1 Tax=Gimesia aquarii TaxID=2527964 RepID=A0A517W3U6_9PLAN|nr:glycosyltransferase [Gimesia aquarii]QDT99931.1 hypothetical protein V144x_54450 [Gimesia aquarii]